MGFKVNANITSPSQIKLLINTILIMFFIFFPIMSYPFNHTPSRLLDKLNQMPSQANQNFIELYTDLNTLWVKHATHQKVVSLGAASLSKLDNMVNNNSISNAKYAEFTIK